MILGLLWIFGSYGLCIVLVHLLHSSTSHNIKWQVNYVLITKNNQLHIEWYLRSLMFLSWLKGQNISITILDEGSEDETLGIAQRLTWHYCSGIQIIRMEDSRTTEDIVKEQPDGKLVVVRLSNTEEMVQIPICQQ